ncbi:MAG: hypothetical protein R2867_16085 [Caldilineaceae bacterium]
MPRQHDTGAGRRAQPDRYTFVYTAPLFYYLTMQLYAYQEQRCE